MADVLLVTAREDYIFAEGVAASLEQSGLSVAQTDGYARGGENAPCVLVLWSIASGRSAAIRNMAVRAQHEGRLIAACLAGGEPPLGFSRPRPFDLTQWDGDPNASALDGMFFAVDRLVCAARLNQGQARPPAASVAPLRPHSALNTPVRARPAASVGLPPSARVAQLRTTRTTAAPAQPPPHYEEPSHATGEAAPLVNEATAWKRIEHSEDPSDFLNYLAEFGPNGLFSELAQLRLDKLSAAKPAPRAAFIAHTPSPHVERPRPQPVPPSARMRPPPPEEDRPWREPPPQQRAEPVRRQARRRPQPAETVAMPPPRDEGGGFRVGPVLAVAALLGAGAAGFFFSRQGGQGPTEVASAPTVEAPLDTNDYYANAVQAGPLAPTAPQARPAAPARAAPAPAQAPTRPRQPAAEDQREVAAYVPPSAAAPAPSISFTPPEVVQPAPPAQTAQPEPPPPAAPAPSAAPAAATAAASAYISPSWISRPTGAQLARVYPNAAMDRNIGGSVLLDCAIQTGGGLSCDVASETPQRMGFGRAALSTVSSFRVATTGADGQNLVGKRVRVPISFRLSP